MSNSEGKLSSEDLAALIIDALIEAKIIQKEHLELAIQITTQEIEIRKAMQDY